MKATVLVRGAKQLLTLRGPREPRRGSALRDLGLIQDGALLIRNGVIEEVGPSRRVENLSLARGAYEIDATGCVVMPGFVDSHTHLVYGLPWLKDYEARISGTDTSQTVTGLHSSVQTVHSVSAHNLASRARRFVHGMARHGTTSFESKSGYGLDETGELKILRVLASLNRNPLDVTATFLGALAARAEFKEESWASTYQMYSQLMPKIWRSKLARFVDVVFDRRGCSLEQTNGFLKMAADLGFLLKIHTDQFCRTGGVQMAVEVSAVSADHLEHADAGDVDMLARSGTMATLLPGSAFHLGTDRYAPARALIDAGATVALATDFNPATSPTYNMQMILALACAQMGMTPAEAISAATINGAHAIRCADRVGSLELGKSADLIMLNVSDYREIPYHFGVNQVRLTMKRGVVIYKEAGVSTPLEAMD